MDVRLFTEEDDKDKEGAVITKRTRDKSRRARMAVSVTSVKCQVAMNLQPTREQLSLAISALSSEAIRAKLQSNELTALGRAVAEEELARRAKEGLPELAPIAADLHEERETASDLPRRLLGWSWGQWLVVTGICVLVVGAFGTTARNKADQSFLYVVIFIQALALAGIVRAVTALFWSSSALGVFGKMVAVGALGFVLFALTLCSVMAQHGWGGG